MGSDRGYEVGRCGEWVRAEEMVGDDDNDVMVLSAMSVQTLLHSSLAIIFQHLLLSLDMSAWATIHKSGYYDCRERTHSRALSPLPYAPHLRQRLCKWPLIIYLLPGLSWVYAWEALPVVYIKIFVGALPGYLAAVGWEMCCWWVWTCHPCPHKSPLLCILLLLCITLQPSSMLNTQHIHMLLSRSVIGFEPSEHTASVPNLLLLLTFLSAAAISRLAVDSQKQIPIHASMPVPDCNAISNQTLSTRAVSLQMELQME